MSTLTSTGAYSTLRSNQGMLNTKRARPFLINTQLVRFKGKNIKSKYTSTLAKQENRTKKLMDQLKNVENQKSLLILTISILSVLLGISIL